MVYRILSGQQVVVRKQAADAILAIQPTAHDAFGLVPSYHTRQLLGGLRSEDYAPEDLAKRLRLQSGRVRLHPKRITVKTALRMRGLYRFLMGED